MTKENLIERIRKIPPTVAANLGYIWGVSEGIQAVDIIQSQSDIVRGAAYVAAGVALVGLNKYVISPVVEGIDKKLTGTKKSMCLLHSQKSNPGHIISLKKFTFAREF